MDELGWRTTLISPAVDLSGRHVPVKTGVIATDPGGLQIALQVDDETTLILADRSAAQMIVNLRNALEQKLLSE
jgi:hypothetical protein